ncbi:MAG: D-glycerate dehydrogenase [bacterium]|nr:D-glycerate dehydrogenase [bacterium]
MSEIIKPKVWASFDPPPAVLEYLNENLDFSYNATGQLATRRMIEEQLPGLDGFFLTLRDFVDAELIEAASDLKIIANLAVGYDNIDLAAANRRGIWVTNTPDVLTAASADLAWALLLAVARRIPEGDRMVRSGQYSGWRHDLLLGTELSGKTLGIWGVGRIGQAIGQRATGFNLRVIYSNRSRKESFERECRARWVEFDELFRRSDFLVLAMPLNEETHNRIGKTELELMKPSAILINIARGGLIREDELIEVLRSKRIAGAGLDVYVDTTGIHKKLGDLEHVVLTPHIGSATRETRERMAFLAARNLIDVLRGLEPENAVNRDEIRSLRATIPAPLRALAV